MMRNVFILGFVSFLTDISSEMVYPLIPVLLMQLGSGPLLMGAIEGLAQSFGSLFKFYFGYASDRFSRRKPFLLFGYGIAAASKAFLALATTSGMVFASRFVDRFGKGVRTAPRDALIAESAPAEKRGAAFGLHRALDTAGAVVGIGIAYVILTTSQGDIRSIFFWALVPGVLSVLLLWFFVRDIPKTDSTARKALPPLRWSMLPKPLRRFMLITVLS